MLNEPLSVCNESTFDSSVVNLVEKLPLSVCKVSIFDSSVDNLLANEELTAVNEPLIVEAVKLLINKALTPNDPLIDVAIWALLLINVLPSSDSAVVNRVLNEPLSVCKLSTLVASVVILEARLELTVVNEPLMSEAIWALLLINVLPSSDSAVEILPARLELVEVNEPLIWVANWAELDIVLEGKALFTSSSLNEPLIYSKEPVTAICLFHFLESVPNWPSLLPLGTIFLVAILIL